MDPINTIASLNPTQKAVSFFEEFKRFAFKGNVIDLAIGVIIGTAFGKIVDSLVKAVIMPAISILLPAQQSYVNWKWVVGETEIRYGIFLGEVVNFLIVAFALYVFIVKFLGWVMRFKKEEQAAAPAPALTKEQELLTEIRDLLKQQAP